MNNGELQIYGWRIEAIFFLHFQFIFDTRCFLQLAQLPERWHVLVMPLPPTIPSPEGLPVTIRDILYYRYTLWHPPRTKKLMCFSYVYKINKRASIKIFLVRNNFANSYTISIDSSHRVAQRVCQCHLMEITKLCKYALNSEFMQIKIMSLLSSNK